MLGVDATAAFAGDFFFLHTFYVCVCVCAGWVYFGKNEYADIELATTKNG